MKTSVVIVFLIYTTVLSVSGSQFMLRDRENILQAIRQLKKNQNARSLEEVTTFLANNDREASIRNNQQANAEWNYETDLVDKNRQKMVDQSVTNTAWFKEQAFDAKKLASSCLNLPADMARQLKLIAMTCSSKSPKANREVSEIGSFLTGIYGKAKVLFQGKQVPLEPDLEQVMDKSRDYDQLLTAWKGWRDATGPKMKAKYVRFVELQNEGAKENGLSDMGECWRDQNYEDKHFDRTVETLWNEIKPFYQKIHAFVRRKLIKQYPNRGISATGPIPAHLLGNMWAQQWNSIMDFAAPYPGVPKFDVKDVMVQKGYTAKRMFKTAEKFFMSIGLEKMTEDFNTKSMITKPLNRPVQCHGSASDFHNGHDYRIKMCTNVTMEYLYVIHHEMGHIEYFMQYRHQPDVYRGGANAGFHEAVGDTIALFVLTPGHMKQLGLLKDGHLDQETKRKQDINFLMSKALEKIAFLPFGYLIDKWRWDVFNGATTNATYNSKWWDLRLKYQGLSPPVPRSETDFDPGAKFHIPANVPYVRYFVSFIIQFQFHKALCDAAGYSPTAPIHHCDISADNLNSKAAGDKLKAMLSLGASKPWPDALEILTGSREIDASAMVNYFKPLIDWLDIENEKNDEVCGWGHEAKKCEKFTAKKT